MTRITLIAALIAAVACLACVAPPAEAPPPPEPWGNALTAVHATADQAIDAGDFQAARVALSQAVSASTPIGAKQDLLQRLAWVELKLGLIREAEQHADRALALENHDERSHANALVVRHMIAVQLKDQAKVDALIEQLLAALDPH